MRNLQPKIGWKNRHAYGMPKKECVIKIIHVDSSGPEELLCSWHPFIKKNYTKDNMPSEGYMGTARKIEEPHKGIGFHAWEQNNHEFVYYRIIR